jgi:hypothetical protein
MVFENSGENKRKTGRNRRYGELHDDKLHNV